MPEPRVSKEKAEGVVKRYEQTSDSILWDFIILYPWAKDLLDARDRITELEAALVNQRKTLTKESDDLLEALNVVRKEAGARIEELKAEIARLRAGYTSGTRFEGKEPG